MAEERQGRTVVFSTPQGEVRVSTWCRSDFIETLEMEEGIGVFAHYRSMVRNRDMLIRMSGLPDSNITLAHTPESKIVGYIIYGYPSRLERWGRWQDGLVYELGSIEVSRNWREVGVASKMLEVSTNDDWLEDKVLILTGYCWHWDLEAAHLSKLDYRRKLMMLFARFGFRQHYTNEPNIMLDLANMLMVKTGSRVSPADRERFLDLCFATGADDIENVLHMSS